MTNKDGRLGISGAQRVSGEGRQKRVWPITSNWSILWITNEHERSESLADHTHTYYWSPHRDIFPKGSIINKKTDRSTGEKWARKPDHNSEQTNKQYPIIDRQQWQCSVLSVCLSPVAISIDSPLPAQSSDMTAPIGIHSGRLWLRLAAAPKIAPGITWNKNTHPISCENSRLIQRKREQRSAK